MRYTGPKFKLCRREQKNLFGPAKYAIKKNTKLPGQQSKMMSRLSEYGLLLRNKQAFRRMYSLTEKQFNRIITKTSKRYAKNNEITHDKAIVHFLESRMDVVLLRAGYAETIMQARQMVVHGHRKLNGNKHNIPSYFVKSGDLLSLKESLYTSPLYEDKPMVAGDTPACLRVDKNKHIVELLHSPELKNDFLGVDVLKVIEFYARV